MKKQRDIGVKVMSDGSIILYAVTTTSMGSRTSSSPEEDLAQLTPRQAQALGILLIKSTPTLLAGGAR